MDMESNTKVPSEQNVELNIPTCVEIKSEPELYGYSVADCKYPNSQHAEDDPASKIPPMESIDYNHFMYNDDKESGYTKTESTSLDNEIQDTNLPNADFRCGGISTDYVYGSTDAPECFDSGLEFPGAAVKIENTSEYGMGPSVPCDASFHQQESYTNENVETVEPKLDPESYNLDLTSLHSDVQFRIKGQKNLLTCLKMEPPAQDDVISKTVQVAVEYCATERFSIRPSDTASNRTGKEHKSLHLNKSLHPNKTSISCTDCERTFTRTYLYKRHLWNHTGVKPYSCDVCEKKFVARSYLKRHQQSHSGDKPYSCNECNKTFTFESSLKSHQFKHCSIEQFSCGECGNTFTTPYLLRRHKLVHMTEKGKVYPCYQCGKSYPELGTLKRHLLIHSDKLYLCTECGKTFTRKDGLQDHKFTHTGQKPFSCTECEKSFPRQGLLIRHQHIHTGEKQFSCNECGRCFTQKAHLKEHSIMHSGEKPFSCTVCGKTYSTRTGIRRHQQSHSGVKPYFCNECGKKFTRKDSLNYHYTSQSCKKLLCN